MEQGVSFRLVTLMNALFSMRLTGCFIDSMGHMVSPSEELSQALSTLATELASELQAVNTEAMLEQTSQSFLGKKGKLTTVLKGLSKLSPEERATLGKKANDMKANLEKALHEKSILLKETYYKNLSESEWVDVSILPRPAHSIELLHEEKGHIHPITQIQKKLEDIFTSMGFSIADGPQVESDFYNFSALNFTDDHPARDSQDTFYFTDGSLLRTHTSSVQIRALQKMKPPLKIIAPGRVFRYEEVDASHEHTFYQMEGMVIDKSVSISNLLHLMQTLLAEIFEKDVVVRLRPGYFPFVEPGFELDMQCLICNGIGCQVCKKSGWVEILPCGLVHPNVIKAAGLDSSVWQGAAFGLGLNRLVMMNYQIEDIRYFQNADMKFLKQF